MTTQSGIVLTNKLNPLSTILNIAQSSTSITIGGSITMSRLTDVRVLKPNVYVWTTLTVSPSISDFLTNGTVIASTYTSATPSTVNDNIIVNLPTPTSDIEGMLFFFRKMRGSINTTSTNWTFNTSPASIVGINVSANTTGYPVSTLTQNGVILRMVVCGYAGTYYWTFI